jgi:hypothetical protein
VPRRRPKRRRTRQVQGKGIHRRRRDDVNRQRQRDQHGRPGRDDGRRRRSRSRRECRSCRRECRSCRRECRSRGRRSRNRCVYRLRCHYRRLQMIDLRRRGACRSRGARGGLRGWDEQVLQRPGQQRNSTRPDTEC